MASAHGTLKAHDRQRLADEELENEEAGNPSWQTSGLFFPKENKLFEKKATTTKNEHSVVEFSAIKQLFLELVFETVTMEEIPPELTLNWDQTGIMIVPSSSGTMHEQWSTRVNEWQITAVFWVHLRRFSPCLVNL